MKPLILYGTETGNAEMLAEDIASHLGDAQLLNMSDATVAALTAAGLLIVVCSTYGEGELPSGARALHAAVEAARPDLSNLRFAAFSLGDKATYPDTFARGGAIWAETLSALGARQLGEIATHDAAGADLAEEIALPWIDDIMAEA
ncbi:MAG TPA: flavodoxin domain-containing protein [Beijerinckiaceae bacterium]|nr:flavodoxin domain-containing protein [Beijerinckiaceae bacterium]